MTIQKAHPTLMTGPLVLASLAGDKRQTMRKPGTQNCVCDSESMRNLDFSNTREPEFNNIFKRGPAYVKVSGPGDTMHRVFPRYKKGDTLWVKETHRITSVGVQYRADYSTSEVSYGGVWKPSIHMPKTACRLFLRITNHPTFMRVQDLTEEEARNEGTSGIDEFISVWDAINAIRGYGWAENPIVLRIPYELTVKPEGWPEVTK